jgi:hypothetical protein
MLFGDGLDSEPLEDCRRNYGVDCAGVDEKFDLLRPLNVRWAGDLDF